LIGSPTKGIEEEKFPFGSYLMVLSLYTGLLLSSKGAKKARVYQIVEEALRD
jgi:hypothetical protein